VARDLCAALFGAFSVAVRFVVATLAAVSVVRTVSFTESRRLRLIRRKFRFDSLILTVTRLPPGAEALPLPNLITLRLPRVRTLLREWSE
jgi:hypothetical protein